METIVLVVFFILSTSDSTALFSSTPNGTCGSLDDAEQQSNLLTHIVFAMTTVLNWQIQWLIHQQS